MERKKIERTNLIPDMVKCTKKKELLPNNRCEKNVGISHSQPTSFFTAKVSSKKTINVKQQQGPPPAVHQLCLLKVTIYKLFDCRFTSFSHNNLS